MKTFCIIGILATILAFGDCEQKRISPPTGIDDEATKTLSTLLERTHHSHLATHPHHHHSAYYHQLASTTSTLSISPSPPTPPTPQTPQTPSTPQTPPTLQTPPTTPVPPTPSTPPTPPTPQTPSTPQTPPTTPTPPTNSNHLPSSTTPLPLTCNCPGEPDSKHDDHEMIVMKKKVVKDFWNKEAHGLNGPHNKMKAQVMKMAKSDSSEWNDSAFVSTAWLRNYYSDADKTPSLCTFAQMINATVAWEVNKQSSALSDAIDQVALSFIDFAVAAGDKAIKGAGCTAPPTMFNGGTCHEDGAKYAIQELWELEGGIMPCELKKITNTLYNSPSYTDKLMAATTTASLSHPFREMLLQFDDNLLYQILELSSSNYPIPTCCCARFIERVKQGNAAYGHEAFRVTENIKSKYGNSWEKSFLWRKYA